MKKFSNFTNENKLEVSINDKINKLIETLNIEIDGEENPWEKSISVSSSEDFLDGIKKIIFESIQKEKLTLLEKAKSSHFTGDVSWINDEIDIIKENLKK